MQTHNDVGLNGTARTELETLADALDDATLEDPTWKEMQTGGRNLTGEHVPEDGTAWLEGSLGHLSLGHADDMTRALAVHYDCSGVLVDVEYGTDDTKAGSYALFSPEQARELAVALIQAAAELETIRANNPEKHVKINE